jgi:hypothetical protein
LDFNFFKTFEGVRGLFWPQSHMYVGILFYACVHMWVVLRQPAYMQGRSFWESVPPKKKCIKKELKCRRDIFVLGPSRSLFHPLNLSKSTSLAKGIFYPFGQFSKCNGENELPASIYRLFWPFCHFFDPLYRFSWLGNHLILFLSFLLDVTIHFSFWFGNFLEDGSL